ncbi:MAG: hypothetical protein U1E62_15070 [Alsobacter sp.]
MGNHLFTYAVGDLNGDHALLTALLDRIHQHADGEPYRLVVLGNTIDGGASPAAVLSALRAIELRAPDRIVTLRGWHEGLMARAGTPDGLAAWMQQGGGATLRSFGVTRLADLPREVVDWVRRRPAEWRDDRRRYVGDPEQALQATDNASAGLHLVHGASFIPGRGGQDKPREAPGITDIDTGAGLGGPLTAAIFTDLQAEPAGYFQAVPGGVTRFLPPQQPNAAIREPRRALRIVNGEPETATAWSLRQDAEVIAAQLAQQKRTRRRRLAYATAAGIVLLLGAGALLARPAATYVAGLLAPASRTAALSEDAAVPASPSREVPVPPAAAAAPRAPEPLTGSAQAVDPAPPEPVAPPPAETVRTHAIPSDAPDTTGAASATPPASPSATVAPAPAEASAVASQSEAAESPAKPLATTFTLARDPAPPAGWTSPPGSPAQATPDAAAHRQAALGATVALPGPAATGEPDPVPAPVPAPRPAKLPGAPAKAAPAKTGPAATAPAVAAPGAAASPAKPAPAARAKAAKPAPPRPVAGAVKPIILVDAPQPATRPAPPPARRAAAPVRPARPAAAPKLPADLETQSIGGAAED